MQCRRHGPPILILRCSQGTTSARRRWKGRAMKAGWLMTGRDRGSLGQATQGVGKSMGLAAMRWTLQRRWTSSRWGRRSATRSPASEPPPPHMVKRRGRHKGRGRRRGRARSTAKDRRHHGRTGLTSRPPSNGSRSSITYSNSRCTSSNSFKGNRTSSSNSSSRHHRYNRGMGDVRNLGRLLRLKRRFGRSAMCGMRLMSRGRRG
mmetsp:Transcript_1387/g.3225  ORF Transcript_1387/g.3225 Transcript_1387/m.3225 type:complete len:205 (+) Transcript_1387:1005-1619(+)